MDNDKLKQAIHTIVEMHGESFPIVALVREVAKLEGKTYSSQRYSVIEACKTMGWTQAGKAVGTLELTQIGIVECETDTTEA